VTPIRPRDFIDPLDDPIDPLGRYWLLW